MVGARKGPHRSLGFAFSYWFQTNGAPDASDITVRGNRTPTRKLDFGQNFDGFRGSAPRGTSDRSRRSHERSRA